MLVLNFEPVTFDYTLETSKMPPLVQYSKYSDAPVRPQPYSYIRANRMKTAGATNQKIIYHSGAPPPEVYYNNIKRAEQTPQSAQNLSRTSLYSAKRIQSAGSRLEGSGLKTVTSDGDKSVMGMSESRMKDTVSEFRSVIAPSIRSTRTKHHVGLSRAQTATKSRTGFSTIRSGTQSVISVEGFKIGRGDADDDSSIISEEAEDQKRRVSWAFEKGLMPACTNFGLPETKSLLRSQIRSTGDEVPPDFVYLTINAIHSNMKPTEASKNMEQNQRQQELNIMRKLNRPNSSPSRLDPRIKVPVEDLDWEDFRIEHGVAPKEIDVKSVGSQSIRTTTSARSKKVHIIETPINVEPPTTKIVTQFAEVPVGAKPHMSLYNERVKSSIPAARLLRPHTAKVFRGKPDSQQTDVAVRPKSAAVTTRGNVFSRISSASRTASSRPGTRPTTAKTNFSMGSSGSTDIHNTRVKKTHGYSTSATEHSFVPMLMYSPEVKNRITEFKNERIQRQGHTSISLLEDGGAVGNVSEFNDPMRNHVDFKLLTHEQTQNHINSIRGNFKDTKAKSQERFEKKQQEAWLARVHGQLDLNYTKKPMSMAPEIREYGEAQTVI